MYGDGQVRPSVVARAHRFVADGDDKYRTQHYAGAAASYREAARVFGEAALASSSDEDAFHALTVLRDSHMRKAERLEGMAGKSTSDIDGSRATGRQEVVDAKASASLVAGGRPPEHYHLHPPASPSSVPASPSSVRALSASLHSAEPWQRFLSVLSRPLGELAQCACQCQQSHHEGDPSLPADKHDVNERLMGSVFLVPSPLITPTAAQTPTYPGGMFLDDSVFLSQSVMLNSSRPTPGASRNQCETEARLFATHHR